jgi:CheY-like chemotaxis protein
MERQVNHLVRLVDDLLEMSRISRGTFELRKERVALGSIVQNAIETSDPLIQSAGHKLTLSMPEEPLWVDGDPVRLAQILANVLNNAAKYTEAGGDIEISASREGSAAKISVRDNGAGISPDALPRLFEMFSRGDRGSGRDQGGLGIGLALARRLVEMHGGSITAHSDGPGHGSEFIVQLPLSAHQSGLDGPGETGAPSIPRKRILVVDDNRDAAESLGMLLEFLGADVKVALDGPGALATFEQYDPAVVLLDIGMPGMDGYEVARRIRADFPDRGTAIVALTGWGQEEDRRRARAAGFDHHLIKPADVGALQALLGSLGSVPN